MHHYRKLFITVLFVLCGSLKVSYAAPATAIADPDPGTVPAVPSEVPRPPPLYERPSPQRSPRPGIVIDLRTPIRCKSPKTCVEGWAGECKKIVSEIGTLDYVFPNLAAQAPLFHLSSVRSRNGHVQIQPSVKRLPTKTGSGAETLSVQKEKAPARFSLPENMAQRRSLQDCATLRRNSMESQRSGANEERLSAHDRTKKRRCAAPGLPCEAAVIGPP